MNATTTLTDREQAPDNEKSAFRRQLSILRVGVILVASGLAVVLIMLSYNVHEDTSETDAFMGIKSTICTIEGSLLRYKMTTGALPSEAQGLRALVTFPNGEPAPKKWRQCLEETMLIDDWGVPYQYRNPGKHKVNGYDVFSKGPDRQEGTEDDIGNW